MNKNIPLKIGKFTLYNDQPNTLAKGYYYQMQLDFAVPNKWNKRMVRVYLPSCYDFNNKKITYPVIYMTDGQNLCDQYLSGYGEWNVDECIENRIRHHQKAFIAVGIDCPHDEKDRMMEMMIGTDPKNLADHLNDTGEGYAEILANFIVNTVKPLIDKTFHTNKTRKFTAVGGSSMGGLMAFYMGLKYKKTFGTSLVFSPGFLIYKANYFKRQLNSYKFNSNEYGKFFFYVGGKDYEKTFVDLTFKTYDILLNKGFNSNQIRLMYDSFNIHHESCWSKYFPIGVSFWLDDKKG